MFYPGLSQHYTNGTSLRFFQDDMVQQIVPYLKIHQPGLFNNYYAGDYFMACMPLGFHGLFRLVSSVIHPIQFALVLPYVLLGLFLLGMGRAAFRLGGWPCCWLVLAFCLCADVYLDRMSGGLARGFGFPIIGLGLAALVSGKIRTLMIVIVGGALFYPSAAVPLGIAMAILLLLCPASIRGEAVKWSLKRRLLSLAATAVVAAACILPTAVRIGPYGPSITPKDIEAFPESGPQGRYRPEERAPFPGFLRSSGVTAPSFLFTLGRFGTEKTGYAGKPFISSLRTWAFEKNYKGEFKRKNRFMPWFYVLALVGWGGLIIRARNRRGPFLRLLLLPLSAAMAYQIARVAAPYFYLPERYVVFPMPPFMALFMAAGLASLPLWLGRHYRTWQHGAAVLLLGGVLVVTFGGRGNDRSGLYRRVMSEDWPLYEAVDQLATDTVLAGWPNKAINYMPLFTHRTPLLTFEIHQAFHQGYALEMRERMDAFMPAYFATELAPVEQLRDRHGVDVLILDQRDFQRRPNYFMPFGHEMQRLFNEQAQASWDFWLKQEKAVLHRTGPYVLVDVHAL